MKNFFIRNVVALVFFTLNLLHAQYPPISPKWVFEPWVWEDSDNNQDSAEALVKGYLEREIPVGAIIIDSPWEWPSEPDSDDQGYNTFIFEPSRYKPEEFIKNLKDLDSNIHVILWITGVMTTDCPYYDYADTNGYFIKKTNGQVLVTDFWRGNKNARHIDFFNPEAVQYWEGLMDQVLDSFKVDGWKVDESDYYIRKDYNNVLTFDGIKTSKEYTDAYYSEFYNYTINKRGTNGMITARPYCDQGDDYQAEFVAPISVNPAGWVGDQDNTWDGNGLTLALKNIFISAAEGYAAVGSDIGGYLNNDYPPDRNLFLRWVQLGALLPIMENGGKKDNCHLPWLFDPIQSTTDIYRYYAKLHHELVPYFYSYDIEAHTTKKSIVRPFGERINNSWNGDWKYLLGDNLFVAAIYQDDNSRTITFPSGNPWINYWNEDDIHQGGTTAKLNYQLKQYPIFIRSGAIIPMNVDDDSAETGHGSDSSKNYLTLLIYPDGLSAFEYNSDPATSTRITCDERCGGFIISFSRRTGSVIVRLKNKIEPRNISISGGINLQ